MPIREPAVALRIAFPVEGPKVEVKREEWCEVR